MPEFITDIEQRTEEWFALRCGVITSSCFKKLITGTGKPSTSKSDYLYELAGQKMLGSIPESFSSSSMRRGSEMEGEARQYFEIITGLQVGQVAFVFRDQERQVGCSPDGIINDDIGLEIKCRDLKNHTRILHKNKMLTSDVPQVQGSMYVTGFRFWWYLSYYPGLPPFMQKIARDEEYQKKIDTIVSGAVVDLHKINAELGVMEAS